MATAIRHIIRPTNPGLARPSPGGFGYLRADIFFCDLASPGCFFATARSAFPFPIVLFMFAPQKGDSVMPVTIQPVYQTDRHEMGQNIDVILAAKLLEHLVSPLGGEPNELA